MQAAALIAEFNPFHNGHQYIIDEIKKITNQAHLIVIMSGDFVQRGEPAVFCKRSRAQMALSAGADLVIELPVRFSIGNAGEFARGAVALLHQLPCVKWLFFGSESGNLENLKDITSKLYEAKKDETYQSYVSDALKTGCSYPKARTIAYGKYYELNPKKNSEIRNIFSSPNDLLGMEYLKALSYFNSKMEPVAIKRICSKANDASLPKDGVLSEAFSEKNLASASTIRENMEHESTVRFLPKSCQAIFTEEKLKKIVPDDFTSMLNAKLLYLSENQLEEYVDVNHDLAHSILNAANEPFRSFEEFAKRIKGKNNTLSRVKRALFHILLEIKKVDGNEIKNVDGQDKWSHYDDASFLPIRVLGFKKDAASLLKNSKAPVITTGATMNRFLKSNGILLEETMKASALYRATVFQKHGILLPDEYHSFPIKLP